jgi:2-aminoadipate transaminase
MDVISFARGVPAPDCLPVDEIGECAQAVVHRVERDAVQYGPPGGFGPLRELLAERHGVEPGQVFLANGSLQGLVFLATHLLRERNRVLVEAPTYDRPLKILKGLGADITALPMDEEGLDPEALERELGSGQAPAFLYTIPTFQNPSGRTLSEERRSRLVELAAEHGLPVVEDDPYGLVRFEGEPVPTLYELAPAGTVAYSSSFSKTVAPGLRVGYLVLPAELAKAVEEIAVSTYVSPVIYTQAIVWEFLRRGLFESNVERVAGLLRERREAMLAALEESFPEGSRWSHPEGGYFLWLDLPEGTDAAELLERCEREGVTFVKGADFYAGPGGESSARLAFSFVSPAEVAEGISRLASVLDQVAAAPPASV